jgi:hypothetical protein
LITGLQERRGAENGTGQKAALYGTKLHQADVLFSLIAQLSHGRQKIPIEELLPTENNQQLLKDYQSAAYRVSHGNVVDGDDLLNRFMNAWTSYHLLTEPDIVDVNSSGKAFARPLPGFGLPEPEEIRQTWTSDELHDLGVKLARAYVSEYCHEDPLAWTFRSDSLSQKEVLVALNFSGPNLQFIIRLDDVTRLWNNRNKHVEAQTLNLKTGQRRELQGLEAEIQKRQKQIELIAGERFVNQFMKGNRAGKIISLKPQEKGIFFMKVNNDSRLLERRLNLAGNLWFNQQNGQFELERLTMTPDEREEFFTWINWYGAMINYYKAEIKKLSKRKPRWDLKTIRVQN